MSIEIITIIVTCLILANNYNNNNNMLLILVETLSQCLEKKPTIKSILNRPLIAISIPITITIITIKIALTIITTNNQIRKDTLLKKTLSSNTQEIKIPVSYITIKLNLHPI